MTTNMLPSNCRGRRLLLNAVAVIAVAVPTAFGQGNALLRAQAATALAPITQTPKEPRWESVAGGKMSFDVASVRQSNNPPSGNIVLDGLDAYFPTGGLFTSNGFLVAYIIFAYKIIDTSQYGSLANQLPKWAQTDKFNIQARTEKHNPTKDQMRLMMQSLLEDRFKLAIHTETRQLPVYALVLDKPGGPGPTLVPHPADVLCPDKPDRPAPVHPGSEPPSFCGAIMSWQVNGQPHMRMIDVTMEQIADYLAAMGSGLGGLDHRPILDRTGLSGRFDFNIEFVPEPNGPMQPSSDTQPEASGPTFTQALKNQLGLKLVKQTGPADAYVIDHVEMPSTN
jgi:uncharacterized protein (TIGR03435 family)